jgi:hypothetical protein
MVKKNDKSKLQLAAGVFLRVVYPFGRFFGLQRVTSDFSYEKIISYV